MTLSAPTPILRIFDEGKAREFYVDFLEFTIDAEHRFDDNAPLYMMISKDQCVLHLSEHHGDASPGSAVRIQTSDVQALNRLLLDKKYRYARPGVQTTPWNTLEMSIGDPFGNRLTFFQSVS